MHKKPLTPLERDGLIKHGLDIGTPSQLSDAFRQGVAWGTKTGVDRVVVQAVLDELEKGGDSYSVSRAIHVLTAVLAPPGQCRADGRCQYAVDHGAEGLGHCPAGKCSMPPVEPLPAITGLAIPPVGPVK